MHHRLFSLNILMRLMLIRDAMKTIFELFEVVWSIMVVQVVHRVVLTALIVVYIEGSRVLVFCVTCVICLIVSRRIVFQRSSFHLVQWSMPCYIVILLTGCGYDFRLID